MRRKWMDVSRIRCILGMGGDLGGLENGPPNVRWGTAHASVPPIFGKSSVIESVVKYEQRKRVTSRKLKRVIYVISEM